MYTMQVFPEYFSVIQNRSVTSQIHLTHLKTAEDLEEALLCHDIVLFSGHSNLGQSMTVWSSI